MCLAHVLDKPVVFSGAAATYTGLFGRKAGERRWRPAVVIDDEMLAISTTLLHLIAGSALLDDGAQRRAAEPADAPGFGGGTVPAERWGTPGYLDRIPVPGQPGMDSNLRDLLAQAQGGTGPGDGAQRSEYEWLIYHHVPEAALAPGQGADIIPAMRTSPIQPLATTMTNVLRGMPLGGGGA